MSAWKTADARQIHWPAGLFYRLNSRRTARFGLVVALAVAMVATLANLGAGTANASSRGVGRSRGEFSCSFSWGGRHYRNHYRNCRESLTGSVASVGTASFAVQPEFHAFPAAVGATVTASTNCSASTTGETQLDESSFVASTNITPAPTDVPQNAITNAVDQNYVAGRFSSDAPQAVGDIYEVKMGSAQTFNEIEMAVPNSATDYATAYHVNVSSDGSTWTTVASCTGTGTPEVASFPAQTDQYVEVVLSAANTLNYWWSIDQFVVYNTTPAPTSTTVAPTTTTVLAGTNCSASNSGETNLDEPSFIASTNVAPAPTDVPQNAITNAVDQSYAAGRFSSDTAQAVGDVYEVNMGSAQTFNEIEMVVPYSPTDYARAYDVNVSSNGSTWTTVASCTGTGTPEIASFPAQTDQYVEVVLTAADTNYYWSIGKFVVYNTTPAPTSTTVAPTTTTPPVPTSGLWTVNVSRFTRYVGACAGWRGIGGLAAGDRVTVAGYDAGFDTIDAISVTIWSPPSTRWTSRGCGGRGGPHGYGYGTPTTTASSTTTTTADPTTTSGYGYGYGHRHHGR
jgi:hypothetical protein